MSDFDASHQGLNILCIDGGGARGLSALVILEEVMKRIQHLKSADSSPHPYQCFDIIAGTGTGAVQACILGRLRMPVDSAIKAYTNLAKEVFSEKKRFGSGSFKITKLKDALRHMIQTATGDPDEPMVDLKQTETQCRTLVFAMSSHSIRAGMPTAFRSYPVVVNEGPKCTIWETLCATMAHPDLFKTFTIGSSPLSQSFVDAGLGCNNPLAHVLSEVKTLYPERYVASITSIGTGHTRTIQIPNGSMLWHLLPIAAITAMKNIATDTERVAEEIARRFNSATGLYYRLNVDQGMQNVEMDGWEQLSEVFAHTHAYLRLRDVSQGIDQLAEAIDSRTHIVAATQIDGEVQIEKASTSIPPAIRLCPAPTPMFTGRESMLRRIESCTTGSTMSRKVCVVHGLGGAGKTQTTLKAVERTYDQWKEVIYVDATTKESIESALKDTAVAQSVGGTYQDALKWLGSYRERWLLVFDNADDPSLPLRSYFPGGNHGSIIVTTRLSQMARLSKGEQSNCNLSSMDPDDALELLPKLAGRQGQELSAGEAESAKALLQDFDYFALAVVHAGSFIGQTPHMSITEYRSLFIERQQQALEAYSNSPVTLNTDDYKYTTHTSYHPLEDSAKQKLQAVLVPFLDANQHWDELLFAQTVTEITSRSLLEYDQTNRSYRIHMLVQSWVRTIIPWEADLAAGCARTLLALSIPFDNSLESIMFRMSLGLHVDKALSGTSGITGPNHAPPFARVYEERGQWKQALPLRLQDRETQERVLGSSHPDTLTAMHNLAYTYLELNRLDEARDLYAQVLETKKRVLGDDHPDTLVTMQELARTYLALNLLEEARDLYAQVLETEKRVLGNDHPDTLKAMHNIAHTYSELNRLDEARDLYVQVLETKKRVLGNDHPDTLKTMHNIAHTYSELNRLDEARDLYVQVLETKKRVLGNDHPSTLKTIHELAHTYSDLNRLDEARDLSAQVLEKKKRVLGNDHPETLRTMYELASTYIRLELWEEAEQLEIDSDKYVQAFGENDVWTRATRARLQEIQDYRQKQAGGLV